VRHSGLELRTVQPALCSASHVSSYITSSTTGRWWATAPQRHRRALLRKRQRVAYLGLPLQSGSCTRWRACLEASELSRRAQQLKRATAPPLAARTRRLMHSRHTHSISASNAETRAANDARTSYIQCYTSVLREPPSRVASLSDHSKAETGGCIGWRSAMAAVAAHSATFCLLSADDEAHRLAREALSEALHARSDGALTVLELVRAVPAVAAGVADLR